MHQIVFFTVIVGLVSAKRAHLNKDRKLAWQFGNPNNGVYRGQPEQIHLSYGGHPSKVFVTWLTFDDVGQTEVDYGTDQLENTVKAQTSSFDAGLTRFVHRALITDIKPGQKYFYRVGSPDFGVSAIYSFVGMKERPSGGFKYAVFGDMGNYNARALGRIQRESQQGDFDAILHVGDMAYDMDSENGTVGDEFMRQIEPVAAYIPYMVSPGNHEEAGNFTHFINRFTMPDTDHNLWYSYDIGAVHFVSFSTEVYFFWKKYGVEMLRRQWDWLVQDLRVSASGAGTVNRIKKANKNRRNVPWIITMGHRPMYCSTMDGDDCTKLESIIRTGIPLTHAFALEKLFYEQGVDLEIWAHEHTYERLWPVYDRVVYNGTISPNVDPPAPVHVLSGSAGCPENTDLFNKAGVWDAVRSNNYGFSRMHVFNATHLHWQQGGLDDDFWVIKTRHQPYTIEDRRTLKRFGTYVGYNAHVERSLSTQDSTAL